MVDKLYKYLYNHLERDCYEKKLLSSSKKNNSTISFVIVLVLLIIYLQNNKLYLPAIEKVISFTIIEEKETEYNSGGEDIKRLYSWLEDAHLKYLIMGGKDATKPLYTIKLNLKDNSKYIIKCRSATIEYNGHLYDINPDVYKNRPF